MFRVIDWRKHLMGVLLTLATLVVLSDLGSGSHNSDHNAYKVREVDASSAKALVDAGALVIDVRGQTQFDVRHIPGAILITIEELRAGIPARLVAEAKDRPILVYCNKGLEHGPEGAAILNQAGFAGAVNLNGEGWAGAGYPVQKS